MGGKDSLFVTDDEGNDGADAAASGVMSECWVGGMEYGFAGQ